MHAVGPERTHGDRRGQRRVDPAREPDHDLAEAVLRHVVAQAELERLAHLLQVVERLRRHRPHELSLLLRRLEHDLQRRRDRRALAGQGAPPHVAQPPPDGGRRIEVDDEQLLDEARRPRDQLAFVVEHDRGAVEDQLVLAADHVAVRDEARVVARPHAQHLLALAVLADVERRGGDVEHDLRAGERQVGRRRAGLPDVLADRRARDDVAEAEQQQVVARGEVAVLVEDAVVRQEALAVDRADLAAREDVTGVVEIGVEVGSADEGDDPVRRGGELLDRAPSGPDERRPQQ